MLRACSYGNRPGGGWWNGRVRGCSGSTVQHARRKIDATRHPPRTPRPPARSLTLAVCVCVLRLQDPLLAIVRIDRRHVPSVHTLPSVSSLFPFRPARRSPAGVRRGVRTQITVRSPQPHPPSPSFPHSWPLVCSFVFVLSLCVRVCVLAAVSVAVACPPSHLSSSHSDKIFIARHRRQYCTALWIVPTAHRPTCRCRSPLR